jgi:glycosyltransferase involved in cell wall biosynthesis
MKIAVMMAAYNAAAYIEAAIGSLLRQQDAADLDIIVGDDGSTDETADVVRALAVPQVRLLSLPHRGVSATRNAILASLQPDTDFFTSLDADDLSPVGRLERCLRVFREDPALDFVYGDSIMFRTPGADPRDPALDGGPTLRLRGVQIGAGLFRFDFISRIGRFDEDLLQAEDLDFLLRMLECGPRFRLTNQVEYYYRRHVTNMTHNHRILGKSIRHAMLKSAKRKSAAALAAVPRGFFDITALMTSPDW